MNCEVLKKIQELDWSNPIEVQTEAIKALEQIGIEEYPNFFEYIPKNCMENFAKVLKTFDFSKNLNLISDLLKWLQDINWPGSMAVLDILGIAGATMLLPYIEEALMEADQNNDDMWIYALKPLVIERLEINISDFSNPIEMERILNRYNSLF